MEANLFVAWGDGLGGFEVSPVLVGNDLLASFTQVVPGDFDGDGHPDLAFILPSGAVSLLYGDGQRHFR